MPTHGSLSKAGKCKWQGNVPHILPESFREVKKRDKKGIMQTVRMKHLKKHKCPRMSKRRAYDKREIHKQKIGQSDR